MAGIPQKVQAVDPDKPHTDAEVPVGLHKGETPTEFGPP
jgi:hypothetical protein